MSSRDATPSSIDRAARSAPSKPGIDPAAEINVDTRLGGMKYRPGEWPLAARRWVIRAVATNGCNRYDAEVLVHMLGLKGE